MSWGKVFPRADRRFPQPKENPMIKRILATAAVLALVATPAFASQCPKDMKSIDAALSAGKGGGMKDKIKALRVEGEKLHKAGKHKESVQTLAEALKLLGK
jgi:hypothetical protein